MIVRFWSKVSKLDDGQCWEWRAAKNPKGYGLLGRGGRGEGNEAAHRYSYMIHIGEIPKGKLVCHKCDNRACVNPNHLFLGTPKENTDDMMQKGRHYTVTNPEKIRRGFKVNPEHVMRGSKNGIAKLSEADIPAIRISPDPQRVIAKRYGVTQAVIWRVKARVTWAHVP